MANKLELEVLIERKMNKINYLQKLIYFSLNPNIKFHYNNLLENEIYELKDLINKLNSFESSINHRMFTIEELSQYDGSNGNPAYAAVKGIVYDVSFNYMLFLGRYFGLCAGKNIEEESEKSYGIQEILNKLNKVGVLI